MKTKTLLLLAFVTLLTTNGCKKYPEDDGRRSLKKPKNRILGIWYDAGILNYLTNYPAHAATSAYGTIDFYSNYVFQGQAYPYFYFDGTWELIDKKEKLKITNRTTNVSEEYTIRKLDKYGLWFRDDSLEYHFKRQ